MAKERECLRRSIGGIGRGISVLTAVEKTEKEAAEGRTSLLGLLAKWSYVIGKY
jgi:hypothetical protein